MTSSYTGKSPAYGLFEKQAIVPDGIANVFPLLYGVGSAGSILVVKQGSVLEPTVDYNIGGNSAKQLVLTDVPLITDSLFVIYMGKELVVPKALGSEPFYMTFTGDGLEDTFSVSPNGPVTEEAIIVFLETVLQRPSVDFTVSGNDIVFTAPPGNGDVIDVFIRGTRSTLDSVGPNSVDTSAIQDGAVTAEKISLVWSNFTPSFTSFGGMGVNLDEIISARRMTLGTIEKLQVDVIITTSGSEADRIRMTLPSSNVSDSLGLDVSIKTDTEREHGHVEFGSTTTIDILREYEQNYSNNTYRIRIRGEYDRGA